MIKRRYRTSHWRWLTRWKSRYGTKQRRMRKERLLPLEFHLGARQSAMRRKGTNRIIQRRHGRMAITGMLSLPHGWPYQAARRRYYPFWPSNPRNRDAMAWSIGRAAAKLLPIFIGHWAASLGKDWPAQDDTLWAIAQLEQRPDQDQRGVMEALALCEEYLLRAQAGPTS